jgi:pimeloyl-ACP methyl ester carboxylesterase
VRAETGIEYDVTGDGRPVILLHGFPDSGRLWRNQVPVLAGAGFRVIVPDRVDHVPLGLMAVLGVHSHA